MANTKNVASYVDEALNSVSGIIFEKEDELKGVLYILCALAKQLRVLIDEKEVSSSYCNNDFVDACFTSTRSYFNAIPNDLVYEFSEFGSTHQYTIYTSPARCINYICDYINELLKVEWNKGYSNNGTRHGYSPEVLKEIAKCNFEQTYFAMYWLYKGGNTLASICSGTGRARLDSLLCIIDVNPIIEILHHQYKTIEEKEDDLLEKCHRDKSVYGYKAGFDDYIKGNERIFKKIDDYAPSQSLIEDDIVINIGIREYYSISYNYWAHEETALDYICNNSEIQKIRPYIYDYLLSISVKLPIKPLIQYLVNTRAYQENQNVMTIKDYLFYSLIYTFDFSMWPLEFPTPRLSDDSKAASLYISKEIGKRILTSKDERNINTCNLGEPITRLILLCSSYFRIIIEQKCVDEITIFQDEINRNETDCCEVYDLALHLWESNEEKDAEKYVYLLLCRPLDLLILNQNINLFGIWSNFLSEAFTVILGEIDKKIIFEKTKSRIKGYSSSPYFPVSTGFNMIRSIQYEIVTRGATEIINEIDDEENDLLKIVIYFLLLTKHEKKSKIVYSLIKNIEVIKETCSILMSLLKYEDTPKCKSSFIPNASFFDCSDTFKKMQTSYNLQHGTDYSMTIENPIIDFSPFDSVTEEELVRFFIDEEFAKTFSLQTDDPEEDNQEKNNSAPLNKKYPLIPLVDEECKYPIRNDLWDGDYQMENDQTHLALSTTVIEASSETFCRFINQLAKEGYISDDYETLKQLVYRLSGLEKPQPVKIVHFIGQEKMFNNLTSLIKHIIKTGGGFMDKNLAKYQKGKKKTKYDLAHEFFRIDDKVQQCSWMSAASSSSAAAHERFKNILRYYYNIDPK